MGSWLRAIKMIKEQIQQQSPSLIFFKCTAYRLRCNSFKVHVGSKMKSLQLFLTIVVLNKDMNSIIRRVLLCRMNPNS